MKTRIIARFAAVALFASLTVGCGNLAEELAVDLIDIAGEPEHIYTSGNDILSGDYTVQGRADSKYKDSEPMALRHDKKGWKLSKDGEKGLHIYEVTPEETAKMFSNYDQKTMQCAGTAKIMDFKICAAPKGTRIRHGKIDQVMESGYIVMDEGDWHHAVKK